MHAFPALGALRYDQLEDAGINTPGRYLVGITLGGELIATARGRNKKDASTEASVVALSVCQERVSKMQRRQTYAPATTVDGVLIDGGATSAIAMLQSKRAQNPSRPESWR